MLGKISSARFGIGGYQDAMIGLHICIDGSGGSVCTDICFWDPVIVPHTENTRWAEEDRDANFAKIVRKISEILNDAKCDNVAKLVGKPVEYNFNDKGYLSDWRILTEVI